MKRIKLEIPNLEDVQYRQKWMQDPNTMNYNAGLEMDLSGYDYQTGTISKNDDEMKVWYDNWIGQEPNKFFAYIKKLIKMSLLEKFIFIKTKTSTKWEY